MFNANKTMIKSILNRLGYTVSKNPQKSKIITNVFNTSHKQNALLSYIRIVFEDKNLINDRRHTNRYTTYLIADALNQSGYNVDVIDYGDDFHGDFSKYNFVIGLGKTLDYVLQFRENGSRTKSYLVRNWMQPFIFKHYYFKKSS